MLNTRVHKDLILFLEKWTTKGPQVSLSLILSVLGLLNLSQSIPNFTLIQISDKRFFSFSVFRQGLTNVALAGLELNRDQPASWGLKYMPACLAFYFFDSV